MNDLFVAVNLLALVGWCFLIFAPKAEITRIALNNMLLPALLCLIYSAFLINEVFLGAGSGEGGFTSITAVQGLFSAPNGVLLGWTHYLAFDLFVGIWIVERARFQNRWPLILILISCMLFGPLGLLVFLGQQAIMQRVSI
jgi:hypothetical protein